MKKLNWSEMISSRLDAGFVLLHEKHKQAAKELWEKYTHEERVQLALRTDYDKEAASIVWCWQEASFSKFLSILEKPVDQWSKEHHLNLVVYLAAAIQFLASKRLLKVQELKEKELEILNELNGHLLLAKQKGADGVYKAMKGKDE